MPKKIRRYNPYNPKVGLYEYRVNVKNKSRSVASGRNYDVSIASLRIKLNKFYPSSHYSYIIKKVPKTFLKQDKFYNRDKAKYGTTSLYY